MIEAISLMPAPRVISRKRRIRLARWAAAVLASVSVGTLGVFAARVIVSDPDAASAADVEAAEQTRATMLAQRDELLARVKAARNTLRAAKAASDHPDWSILLSYVASLCADRAALARFDLRPLEGSERFSVAVSGLARSQADVTAITLGLEKSGVFSEVRLDESASRETGMSFTIRCRIGPAEPPPAKDEKKGGTP